ncbi:unnamed protein product [Ascophyllum nodosum]
MTRRYASLGPSRACTGLFQPMDVASQNYTLVCDKKLPQSRCLSLLLVMSTRAYLFFPARGHEPPPTVCDRFHPHLSRQRRRFSILRYGKRPDIVLYAIGPLFLLPTPSSLYGILELFENDSFWEPPAAHTDERPCSPKSSRAQRCLDALTPGYLNGTMVRGHPMIWSLALCPDDAKQDPRVYDAEFGVILGRKVESATFGRS